MTLNTDTLLLIVCGQTDRERKKKQTKITAFHGQHNQDTTLWTVVLKIFIKIRAQLLLRLPDARPLQVFRQVAANDEMTHLAADTPGHHETTHELL